MGNLIIFGAAGSCGSSFGCYENVSQALLRGTSVAARTRLGVVNLSATLDFQSPTDASTGKLLARRIKRLATLRADTELAGWQMVPLCRPPASALTMPPTPSHWLAMPSSRWTPPTDCKRT